MISDIAKSACKLWNLNQTSLVLCAKRENHVYKVLDYHKFNGCGLVISSEVIKSGANIPRGMFFVHEDTVG